jgi:L-aminopeptidase/D-esterase-like protein
MATGQGPVRTGVTAILPRGRENDPVFAGWYALNGNGEMTGTTWIEESGFLQGPVMITNTSSVGLVRDAVIDYSVQRLSESQDLSNHWFLPVVAETFDGFLSDIHGFHVKREHVFEALDNAASGIPGEGNVGGGTGMVCHGFKGGIGTSSRIVRLEGEAYVVGALVQAN